MKTFQEACHAVLLRKYSTEDKEAGTKAIPADLMEASDRYAELHEEIQNSLEARAFVGTLYDLHVEHKTAVDAIMADGLLVLPDFTCGGDSI